MRARVVGAKLATIAVPFLFKDLVDAIEHVDATHKLLVLAPSATVLLLGVARTSAAAMGELRDVVFANVSQDAIRRIALDTFRHLHALDLRWHMSKQTGAVTRVIDRGTLSVDTLLRAVVFRIVPTTLELALVTTVLASQCGAKYSLAAVATLAAYTWFTAAVTTWRTKFRQDMKRLENRAATRALDSLANFETVKIFGNERYETDTYGAVLAGYSRAALKTQSSLSLLNAGQNLIFTAGLTAVMYMATSDILAGRMTVGDLILVNGLLQQLAVPLNFVGTVYRETAQAMTDLEELQKLRLQRPLVSDAPGAPRLVVPAVVGGDDAAPALEFSDVRFAYEAGHPPVLDGLSLRVERGQTVALVGPSGCGKSTALRLMFRFYDADEGGGAVRVFGQDVRAVTGESLRAAMAVVPQDTVLFNDTLLQNLAYGNLAAPRERIDEVVRSAQLSALVDRLPKRLDTLVGERGLKLSGGERQRVAIARAMLKDAPILLCDEATSSLDTRTEADVMTALNTLARGRTTVLVAHRLQSVLAADRIFVLDKGRVAESGTHEGLLATPDSLYSRMWRSQRDEARQRETQQKREAQQKREEGGGDAA